MEMKNNLSLEVQKGDHRFVLYIPHGVSWGNALDAAYEMLQEINKLAQKTIEQNNPSNPKDQ